MKKYSWMVALFAIMAIAFGGFVSCGGDDGPETVTVTFNPQGGTFTGGSTANSVVTINKGATVTIPTVTKENYTFQRWDTNADGTGTALAATTTFNANATYHAIWQAAGSGPELCPDCGEEDCICPPALTIIEDFTAGEPGEDGAGGTGNAFGYPNSGNAGFFTIMTGANMSNDTLKNAAIFTGTGDGAGWIAQTASGGMASMHDATAANAVLDFFEDAGASEGQALRFVFDMTATRYLKFGYNGYDVDLTDKTELVVRLKSSVAGRFGIIVQSSETASNEGRYWVTVAAGDVDTWKEFTIPLSDFFEGNSGSERLNPSGKLETIAFLVAGQWNNGHTGNNAGTGTGARYGGTLLIDYIGIR